MRFPKLRLRLTIRTKLLVLSGALIAALVGSNVYMRCHISAGTAALGEQTGCKTRDAWQLLRCGSLVSLSFG